jgi:hypothetical protein
MNQQEDYYDEIKVEEMLVIGPVQEVWRGARDATR